MLAKRSKGPVTLCLNISGDSATQDSSACGPCRLADTCRAQRWVSTSFGMRKLPEGGCGGRPGSVYELSACGRPCPLSAPAHWPAVLLDCPYHRRQTGPASSLNWAVRFCLPFFVSYMKQRKLRDP